MKIDFGDEFENRQIDNFQAAKLILRILDFKNVLMQSGAMEPFIQFCSNPAFPIGTLLHA